MRKEVLLDEKSRIRNILLEHGLEEGFQERIGSDPALKPNSRAYNFVEVGIVVRVLRLEVSVWIC